MQRGSFPSRSSSLYGWLLVGIVGCIGYLIFRKTKSYWMKLLFPVGWETDWYIPNNAHRFLVRYVQCRYYLYTTRLGYGLHLRRLSKKRHGPHSITQPLSLSGNYTIYTLCKFTLLFHKPHAFGSMYDCLLAHPFLFTHRSHHHTSSHTRW